MVDEHAYIYKISSADISNICVRYSTIKKNKFEYMLKEPYIFNLFYSCLVDGDVEYILENKVVYLLIEEIKNKQSYNLLLLLCYYICKLINAHKLFLYSKDIIYEIIDNITINVMTKKDICFIKELCKVPYQ